MIPFGIILIVSEQLNWDLITTPAGYLELLTVMVIVTMTAELQQSFRALAEPTRRQILLHLSQRDMTIAEVAEHFSMTRAAVKKHLGILEEGQLISVRARGRERVNHLEYRGLKSVAEWIEYFEQFWDDKLANLKRAIENEDKTNKPKSKSKKQQRKKK